MECCTIPEISYNEFGNALEGRFKGRRIPLKVTMELTERCNLRCIHCYINRPAGDQKAESREMSLEQIASILDQAAELGTLWLLLTGGEPLLRPDFERTYLYAKQKGFLVTVFTNGTLVTPRIASLLAEWPPELVEITLYGRTRETYEGITGIAGSYQRCLDGIGVLLEHGVKLGLKTIVMTRNLHELAAMKEFAQSLGVRFRYDPIVRPRLRNDRSTDPRTMRISPQQVVDLEASDKDADNSWLGLYEKYGHVQPTDELYGCTAGIKVFHVDAFGRMRLCMGAPAQTYDLLQGTVRQGWETWAHAMRLQPFTQDFLCRHCNKAILCVRCPGFAELENGDPESVVEHMCEIAHLRAARFWPQSAD